MTDTSTIRAQTQRFTYADPKDKWFKRTVIKTVELMTGRRYLQKIYDELHIEGYDAWDVWPKALEKLNVSIEYDANQLAKIPATGPLICVANHPFGVVDGLMLCHLVTRVRRDFFILVNEVVADQPILKNHFLPVDFRGDKRAIATNLKTKQDTTNRINNGETLIIFPSGAVATAMKWGGGVEEFPWRRFISTRIHQTQCTVVPFYFYGTNSWLFQFVSKISMNLRLGLLLNEVMNKRGKTFKVDIGNPISYDEMAPYKDRQALIEFLRERTLNLPKQMNGHS